MISLLHDNTISFRKISMIHYKSLSILLFLCLIIFISSSVHGDQVMKPGDQSKYPPVSDSQDVSGNPKQNNATLPGGDADQKILSRSGEEPGGAGERRPGLISPGPTQTISPVVTPTVISPSQPDNRIPDINHPGSPGNPDHEKNSDKSPALRGSIQVISNPSGAMVYLNNEYRGKTPSHGYLEISDLTPGTYSLLVRLSGYGDYSSTVTVTGGERETVNCILSVIVSQTTTTGSLTLQSSPINSGILLDNEYRGKTPVTLQNVAQGVHTVILQKQGYTDYVSTVRVTAGETTNVSAVLSTVTTTPSPVPTSTGTPYPVPSPEPTQSGLPAFLGCTGLVIGFILFIRRR